MFGSRNNVCGSAPPRYTMAAGVPGFISEVSLMGGSSIKQKHVRTAMFQNTKLLPFVFNPNQTRMQSILQYIFAEGWCTAT